MRACALFAAAALTLVALTVADAGSVDWRSRVNRWVNDFAGILKPEEREALDARLRDYQQTSGNHIVLITLASLEGDSPERLTLEIAQQAGIGVKGKENGLLLAVFVQEHKARIEVGYGLEPVITDAISSRIIREDLGPAFREQRYGDGLSAAVATIIRALAGEGLPPEKAAGRGRRGSSAGSILSIIIMIVIVLLIISSGGGGMLGAILLGQSMTSGRGGWQSRGGGGWGGLGGGGGGGGYSGGGGSFGGGGATGSW